MITKGNVWVKVWGLGGLVVILSDRLSGGRVFGPNLRPMQFFA